MQRKLVDPADRTVSSRVFTDPDIYTLEQKNLFARTWLYVGHRSQFRLPGDFIQASAGTVPLLVCLDEDGEFHAIANVCSHRGGRICQVEQGNAIKFVCPYHNWTYNNRGDLVGVPRQPSAGFDRSRWNLFSAARVATYRDLIFCNFSAAGPSLEEYLGNVKWYLDLLLQSSPAGTEVSSGTHRSVVRCNWKIPAEQFGSDNWHFQGVHASLRKLGRGNEDPGHEESFHVWTDEGHMIICIAPRIEVPSLHSFHLDELVKQGHLHARERRLLRSSIVVTIFPNLSFVYFPGMCSIRVWHPRAADRTELWSWALYNRDAPDSLKDSIRTQVTRSFSPTGMLEQDDLEVWSRLASNLQAMPDSFRLCYEFGSRELSAPRPFPGMTTSLQSDTPAFAFYRRWAQFIDGSAIQ
jgi:phenylpropionate dioxygenase-like ring-hydroxylating dioxygenase large terminal subunit